MKVVYIVCPLCGLNRVLEKKGSAALLSGAPEARAKLKALGAKGPIRFDRLDPHTSPFVQVREVPGGRGGGFHLQETHTLAEALEDPSLADLVAQLQAQVESLHAFFHPEASHEG